MIRFSDPPSLVFSGKGGGGSEQPEDEAGVPSSHRMVRLKITGCVPPLPEVLSGVVLIKVR